MGKLTMTRRTFAKMAAATAAAVGVAAPASSALAETKNGTTGAGEVKRIRSTCRGCGKMECGVWVYVQDGKVIRSEGDEAAFQSMGNHCSKGQASLQAAYHPDRLKYPMKRTNPKDSNDPGWQRITWDEAMETIGEKFSELQSKYGNETYFSMAGTSRIWSMGPYAALKQCFVSPNAIQANEICKGPRFYATKLNDYNAYSWMETVGRPRVYVQWGGASELSNYDDSCRTTVDVATRADYHILVDPRQTNLGKEADIWLPLRPGTDAAMGLGWINVVINKGLYDDLYVRKWMNAPMLVVEDEDWEPSVSDSQSTHGSKKNRLLKQSDIKEGGSNTAFMVLNELNGELTYYESNGKSVASSVTDASAADLSLSSSSSSGKLPHWEGEDWKPATAGREAQIHGLDLTGQSQGFVIDATPFIDGLYPALYTPEGGLEVTLKDGKKVHCRTVWEHLCDRVAEYTPEKVAEITGCKAEDIERAATIYATRLDPSTGYGNGGIQYMLPLEHSCNSLQTNRTMDILCGITGNMDIPGGMRGSTAGWPFFDLAMTLPSAASVKGSPDQSKIIGGDKFPMLADPKCNPSWADATSIYKTIETGQPYKLSCGIGQTGDHMNQSNSLYAYEQLKKLDFWVSIDLWETPTVGVADIVLPAAHWMELDCIRKSQGSSGSFGATCKAVEPPAEAEPDLKIVMRIFKAMGQPYCEGSTDDEKWPIDDAENVCNNIALAGFRIPEWQDYKQAFQENGPWDSKIEKPEAWGTYRRYETGWATTSDSPAAVQAVMDHPQGWDTSTGKQEIWSTVIDNYYPNDDQAIPTFREAPHGPVADPDLFEDDNSFLATTGRRIPVYFHNEHRQLPWCRELWPVPRIEMNPEDAERIGVEQGDWVWIETKEHKIREVVDLYHGIAPGVVNLEHQWWFPELKQADKGFALCGVNCLLDKDAQDPFIGTSNLRAYGVKVYKATAENSPFGNPVPCGDDGTEIIHDSSDPRLKAWAPDYEGRTKA